MSDIKKLLNKDLNFKESFIFLASLLSLYLLPLIINGINYRDDYVRALRGNDWDILGRKLADLSAQILTFGFGKIVNVSPLTYILSIVIIALSLSYFIIKTRINKSLLTHIALSFLFLGPLYLQNFSYKYDNLPMTLSVCLALLSFSIRWDNYKKILVSTISLTCSLFLFQPSSNIFLVLCIMGFIIKSKEEKEIPFIFKSLCIYSISILSYYIWLKYINNLAETTRGKIVSLNEFGQTFKIATSVLKDFLSPFVASPIFLFICLLIIFYVLFIFCKLYKSKETVLYKVILILSPILLFISIWGPFILLDEIFSRPRVFVSIGAILSCLMLIQNIMLSQYRILNYILMSIWLLFSFSLMYQYANLQKEDDLFNRELSSWIAYDINNNEELYSLPIVYVNGFPEKGPNTKVIMENNPFLKYINMPYYNWFSRFVIESMGVKNVYKDINNIDDKYDWESICKFHTAVRIKNNRYYDIYIIENNKSQYKKHVSVWFKRNKDLCQDEPNLTDRKAYETKEAKF